MAFLIQTKSRKWCNLMKIFPFIILGIVLYFVQSIDPTTNKSNINPEVIKQTVSENISVVKEYINTNWFTVKKVEGEADEFELSVNPDIKSEVEVEELEGLFNETGEPTNNSVKLTMLPNQLDIYKIADLIDKNETNRLDSNLVHWNKGESFASLGIGHFIWYPRNRSKEFNEQFPSMIRSLQNAGVKVPKFITKQIKIGSFWRTRKEWKADKNSRRFKQLVKFLSDTKVYQAQYIQQTYYLKMFQLYSISSNREIMKMNKIINKITRQRGGTYVLIDYVNFKGIGGRPNKKYKNYDWGLKTVLLNMSKYHKDPILTAFSKAATYTLEQRVKNAPKFRRKNEKKFMKGWRKRTNRYKDPYQ